MESCVRCHDPLGSKKPQGATTATRERPHIQKEKPGKNSFWNVEIPSDEGKTIYLNPFEFSLSLAMMRAL
jgi:hypothetical protein